MNYRTTKLLAQSDIGPSGTKSIDINLDQPISRLQLEWQVMKAATPTMNDPCHKDISKIELVDGSDVLFAMDGGQAQALNIYDRKCGSMNQGTYIAANNQRSYYGIDFGRYLFDPVLALDPKRFKNLQLKVTYSEIISDTAGSAGSLEVIADVFDEKIISPEGFLMSKVHHAYTVGAHQSYEYIDLPTDFPLRKLLIQGYSKGYEPWMVVEEARLNEDNEKRIPFDWDLYVYYRHRKGIDTPVQEEISAWAQAAGNDYYLTPTDYWATMICEAYGAYNQFGIASHGRGGHFNPAAHDSVAIQAIVKGWLPNHCFQFPFGDPMDLSDWYDVTKIAHLQIRLRAGTNTGADGTGAVVLQQLRRY